MRLFYVLDSFSGQLWLTQDSLEIVPSGEIAEDVVPDIFVCNISEEYVCNGLSSFPTWTSYAGNVWYQRKRQYGRRNSNLTSRDIL